MSKVQLHALIVVALLVLTAVATRAVRPPTMEGAPNTSFSKIPLHFGEWTGSNDQFDDTTRQNLPSASLLLRFYKRNYEISPVGLAIVYGTDLGDFHQPEVCLEGQGLQSVSKSIVKIKDGKGGTFDAVSLITEDTNYRRQAFVFWFYTEGEPSTSLGRYKVNMLMDRLFMRRIRPSAMIRLSTVVANSEEESTAQLVQFASEVFPYLKQEFDAGIPAKVSGK